MNDTSPPTPPPALQSLALLLDGASTPFLLLNATGSILWSNQAARRLESELAAPGLREVTQQFQALVAERSSARTSAAPNAPQRPPQQPSLLVGAISLTYPQAHNKQLRTACALACDSSAGQYYLLNLQEGSALAANSAEAVATVAHDLKNPISAVFGYADTLLDTPIGEGLTAQQREIVARMRHTAARAIDLVRNYQYLSDLEYLGVRRCEKAIDANLVLQSVVDNLWREEQDGPRLLVTLSEQPLLVYIDRISLDRVLSNLLSNAIKFTPKSGLITLASCRSGRDALLTVSNTGSYISPAERAMIFQRFQRGELGKDRGGSGLGLYIAQRLVQAYAGTLLLESDQAQGTRFEVRFGLKG